jgi:hypothetical protein
MITSTEIPETLRVLTAHELECIGAGTTGGGGSTTGFNTPASQQPSRIHYSVYVDVGTGIYWNFITGQFSGIISGIGHAL